jgi:DNA primase
LRIPGASNPDGVIGPWLKGRVILIATDLDAAGDEAAWRLKKAVEAQGGEAVRVEFCGEKDIADAAKKIGLAKLGEEVERVMHEARGDTP